MVSKGRYSNVLRSLRPRATLDDALAVPQLLASLCASIRERELRAAVADHCKTRRVSDKVNTSLRLLFRELTPQNL